jgi:hypothetical protein
MTRREFLWKRFPSLSRHLGSKAFEEVGTSPAWCIAAAVAAPAAVIRAARDLLRCLRLLVRYAIKLGIRHDDPGTIRRKGRDVSELSVECGPPGSSKRASKTRYKVLRECWKLTAMD